MTQFHHPPAPPSYQSRFVQDLIESIRRAMLPLVSKDEAVGRILLQSPNGTVYEVKVGNDGTLTTTVNDGKSRL
jgi:hypothetical protein